MDEEVILDYEEFKVIYDYSTYRYIYVDDEDTFEVFLVATLKYDCMHEPTVDAADLCGLFDCICCGEYIGDDGIEYLWFDTEEPEEDIA